MRNEKLNFGIIIRALASLIPLAFGMPSLAVVMCAYNIFMSFVVFGTLSAIVTSLAAICISIFIGQFYGNIGVLSGLVTVFQAIFSAVGIIYGYLLRRRFSYGLILGTAGILIPQFFFIKSQATNLGVSVAQSIVPNVEDIKEILGQTLSQIQPVVTDVHLDEIAIFINRFTTMLIPSIFIISSLVLAYVVLWTVSVPLNKLNIGVNHSFVFIRIPRGMSVAFIALLILIFATANIFLNEYLLVLLLNMTIILAFICFTAGLSISEFFLRKFIKFTTLRVLLHIAVLFVVPIFSFVYVLIACVDSFINFRKINPVNNPVKKGDNSETEK